MIYPVITLYQPWATWIMRGWKTIETRTHDRFKSLNGKTILIHAGQKTDASDLTVKNKYLTQDQILYMPDEIINGHILGSVEVKDFRLLHPGLDENDSLIECFTVRYGLFLTDVQKFERPIPCKGDMGIWYYDLQDKKKVRKPEIKTQYGIF